jgi:predicted nuclease with TOPRIM domain
MPKEEKTSMEEKIQILVGTVGSLATNVQALFTEVRRNSVLLEAVNDKIVILAEGQEVLHEKVDRLEGRFSNLEEKFDHLDARLISVEVH